MCFRKARRPEEGERNRPLVVGAQAERTASGEVEAGEVGVGVARLQR